MQWKEACQLSIVMSANAMTFKRFLPLIVEWNDVKNKCIVSRNNPCSLSECEMLIHGSDFSEMEMGF